MFGGKQYDPNSREWVRMQGAITQAGLARDDVNITNRVLVKPWNNEFSKHRWDNIKEGKEQLFSLIDQLQPSIIVAMGNEAAFDLVPGRFGSNIYKASGILEKRGFFWNTDRLPCPVLTTLHPASCLYQPLPHQILFQGDMNRLGRWVRGEFPQEDFPYSTRISGPGDMAPIWDSELVSFDIEIDGGGFLCVAFCDDDLNTYLCYDLSLAREWLESDRRKLAHNKQFDTYWLSRFADVTVGGTVEDTMILHWACWPELAGRAESGAEGKPTSRYTRKSLNFLASWHINVPWWKDYTHDRALMGELCSRDVFVTRRLWDEMYADGDQLGVLGQYERSRDMVPMLNKMTRRGLLVNEGLRQQRMTKLRTRQSLLEEESRKAAIEYIEENEINEFRQSKQCKCCGGGDRKRAECWSCAGFDSAPNKGELVDLARSQGHDAKGLLKRDLERLCLAPCSVCGGDGSAQWYEFKPMSQTQMPSLLWEHLRIPRGIYAPADKPNAQEDTLKAAYRWASEA